MMPLFERSRIDHAIGGAIRLAAALLLLAVTIGESRAEESGVLALLPANVVSSHAISAGGRSRAVNPDDEEKFWGVEQDAAAIGAFIRLYLQTAKRLGSAVFLVGESYGGFRVALLCRTLQEDAGIVPSGAVLISPALELSLLSGEDFDPLTWALPLPSFAAVELEHQGVHGRAALAARLPEAEHFALSDYLTGLAG